MIGDEQTQRLPADPQELASFANFCGYPATAPFAADLVHHFERVAEHYARLFEAAPALSGTAGSLVFTGVSDDPETLETLRGLVSNARNWRRKRSAAGISAVGRASLRSAHARF